MYKKITTDARRNLLVSTIVLGLFAALFILPYQFQSEAVVTNKDSKGLVTRTTSHESGLENYDIREHKSEVVAEQLVRFRQESGKSASFVADVRDSFVRGETDLRKKVSSLKVEYNRDIRIPEVITPDVWKKNIERLSAPTSGIKNAEVLRNFAKQNNQLVGMNNDQLDSLKVLADYENPSGNMSFAQLEQRINGIPVFRGEIKAGFTKNGEIVRVINNLAPGLDYDSLSTDFKDPSDAVKAAAGHINYDLQKPDTTRNEAVSTEIKTVFGEGDWATTAEKMYFPTEVGTARTAWRVLIWQPVNAYYVIVDAETGTMLWRKNITEDQTQAATYNVYVNPLSQINSADSPAPLTPYTGAGPADGTQGALTTRTDVTLIGNEGDLSFNNNGWVTDGANGTDGHTDGNSNEAGIDIDGTNGVDAPVAGTSRTFTSMWNPPPGAPAPGDAPTAPAARDGAVIQMFYIMNRYHDELYKLGFNEQAFNFQDNNFGRGGAQGDRVSSEGQDSAGTNNANFATPADGGRGRMQMFVFTGPTPDRDGTADADIIIHEVTHGLSNRLHGNAAGLGSNMSRGMGEGWSDFYAFSLLSGSTDPVDGIYAGGGHVLLGGFGSIGTDNYYYGIRSFPKATLTTTGGPSNNPHNPLTFADLDSLQESRTDGAFPPKTGVHISTEPSQVHRAGEVWSSLLWEVRGLMMTRLGQVAGNQKAMQVITDGMKLAPLNPTFVQEGDAIIAAAGALPAAPQASADVADVREGFRRRGMGFGASVDACCGTSTTRVTESFDFPNVTHIDPFSVSDASGDNDGYPEPGESVTLNVAVTNTTGGTITNVMANADGGTNVAYGNVADGATVTMPISYTIPSGSACGTMHTVQINVSSDVGAQAAVPRMFRLGAPVGGAPAEFSNATQIDLPAGQPGTTGGPASPYPSDIAVSGLTGGKKIKVRFNNLIHEYLDDIDMLLVGPGGEKFVMMSDTGGSTEQLTPITFTIADDATDILPGDAAIANGGTFKPSNVGAGDVFDSPAPATPHENAEPAGSATFESVFGTDGTTMNGTWSLYGEDDAGLDPGFITDGWTIIFEANDFVCDLSPASGNGRADFDGDGRTDISVFRPSEGNWYVNQSNAGFSVLNWGLASDTLVPGDYDGDGKTDTAIFRPSDTAGVTDWWVLNSSDFSVSGAEWGLTSDVPVVGDYDGDDKDDFAVYRGSNSTWYIINSGGGAPLIASPGGQSGVSVTPVVGDFDGDGKADLTTFSNGTWNSTLSGGGTEMVTNGAAGDVLLAGDFDGDGQSDQATWRDSDGSWYIWMSNSDSQVVIPFGASGDIPTPGDYDGDGTDDVSIYRNGDWWTNGSTSGISVVNFGLSSDSPIPAIANP